MKAEKIKNEFNAKAFELGCRARIGGSAKKEKFYEWNGGYTSDDCEIWYPITSQRFAQLTDKFKELQ